jgi:hypothetical protein
MDEKKYQVFVSSTYTDLLEARKKIILTVLNLYHFPVGMEMFSADDSEQWDIIRETIEGSDYYVIIIGHKYGSVAPTGLSYTEMEYDYAKSLGIPVLAFIRDRNVGTLPHERESDTSKSARLDSFIEKAKANKMCDFWNTIDDLATKVAIALPKIMRRTPQIGWVRGDQVTSKEISNELAELSTENRTLREKLRDYESQLQTDAPILKLSMIDEDLTLNLPQNFTPLPYAKAFSREDIPAKYNHLITDDVIKDYNARLPVNEEIDRYNQRLFFHECFEKHAINLTPILQNTGKKVATDIHIHIELPSFLLALCDDNEFLFKIPSEPYIPDDPVKELEIKLAARQSLSGVRRRFAVGDFTSDNLSSIISGQENLNTFINRGQPLNASDWVEYKRNEVILRARKLIQSLSIEFDDVLFIPIKKGEGEINFKLVCEELKEPITFSHKVIVS